MKKDLKDNKELVDKQDNLESSTNKADQEIDNTKIKEAKVDVSKEQSNEKKNKHKNEAKPVSIKKEKKQKNKENKKLEKEIKKQEVIERYNVDFNVGLSSEQVQKRSLQGLTNYTHKTSYRSSFKIILKNLCTFFNFLTIGIGVGLIIAGSFKDLLFLVIVLSNVIIGIVQELRAKKAIDKLNLISQPTAKVIRNGEKKEISYSSIVLDDIIYLDAGKQIPSDSIICDGVIEVNESMLTGESDSILKKPGDILYSGSFVISGSCYARADKVGKDNYIDRLTSKAKQYKKPKSELNKSLKNIIFIMGCLIIPIGIALFLRQNNVSWQKAYTQTAGAIIGMIPSGLYLLSSSALGIGVFKLSKKKVLVQDIYCMEMLARVNILCLDKTGTITDGSMDVKNIIEYSSVDGMNTKNIISSMLYSLNENNVTAQALEKKFGKVKKLKEYDKIPFSSQRKFNAVSFEGKGTFVLGAPEYVLKEDYDKVKKEVEHQAQYGYRVLCLVHKEGYIENQVLPEGKNEILSLILIEDNLRPDAIETIDYFKKSGVDLKVISGDNPITVSKISQRAGIPNASEYISLDGLNDEEVKKAANKYTVFGRVSPNQKALLIKTLKSKKNNVAMTGDGVNDILALREADCSIAIASGSEAARNVSHLVLLNSNFSSMPEVVSEGRRVINNVSKIASLFLTKTIFSLLLALYTLITKQTYPISPIQLFLIDFLCIGIPSFVLVLEPNNNEVNGKFLSNIIKGSLPGAIVILCLSMLAFFFLNILGLSSDACTLSTVIVLVATHTCFMVLYKICIPFNRLRKILFICCYGVFILLTFLCPKVFNFRPITKFNEYTSNSDKIDFTVLNNTPNVLVSEKNRLIVNGCYTDLEITDSEFKSNNHFVIKKCGDNDYYYYNNRYTGIKFTLPSVSKSNNNLYIGGYKIKTDKELSDDIIEKMSFRVNSDGFVEYLFDKNDKNEEYKTTSCRIVYYKYDQGLKILTLNNYMDLQYKNYNAKNILFTSCDGKNIYFKTRNKEEIKFPFKLSYNGKELFINATEAKTDKDENISFLSDNKLSLNDKESTNSNNITLNYNGKEFKYTICSPMLSESGNFIIDNLYTEYKSTGESTITFKVSNNKKLIICDQLTEFDASVKIENCTVVSPISYPALILLLLLCFASAPLMRFVQAIVPYFKKNINYMLTFLTKI